MPSALVVAGIHRAAQPAFDFESDDVGVEERATRRVDQFRGGERRGDERRAGMRERHEAHVVEVQRVGGGAVRQCRTSRRCAQCRADDAARIATLSANDLLDDSSGRLGCASEHDPDRIQTGGRSACSRVGWRRRVNCKLSDNGRGGLHATPVPTCGKQLRPRLWKTGTSPSVENTSDPLTSDPGTSDPLNQSRP